MGRKHVALTDAQLVLIGRRHGSEQVRAEAGETLERIKRDVAVMAPWGIGATVIGKVQAIIDEHGALLATRGDAVAAKGAGLGKRDSAVNNGWIYVQQVEGALSLSAMSDPDLAEALNAALPAETDELEASIRAMGKLLGQYKTKVDPELGAEAKVAEAEGLAKSVAEAISLAPIAKSAPVADTREIDLLDGKLATYLARLNKTARRAFRAKGDDRKVAQYRFHHLNRSASGKPDSTPPSSGT